MYLCDVYIFVCLYTFIQNESIVLVTIIVLIFVLTLLCFTTDIKQFIVKSNKIPVYLFYQWPKTQLLERKKETVSISENLKYQHFRFVWKLSSKLNL